MIGTELRKPDSLPYTDRPPGSADEELPFEHVVMVMVENYSFGNLLGTLPISGQPLADSGSRSTPAASR